MPNITQLRAAFLADGFEVVGNGTSVNGKLGVTAKHLTARINGDPQKPKKAYYVEGTHKEMGYLLGVMAEPDIARMTTLFINNMLWALAFWHPRASQDPPDPLEQTIIQLIKNGIGDMLNDLVARFSQAIGPDIPAEYLQELEGLWEGCRAANPNTSVNMDDLRVLNFGVDWFLANVYTGFGSYPALQTAIFDLLRGIDPPGMCNGFSVFGQAAGGGHYFGRDFMFPTAGVFEKTACLIVYNPDPLPTVGPARIPFVSMTAPGFVGSIAAMNRRGVAIGVEIAPATACDPQRPGLNSLLLNRHCVETGATAVEAKDVIVNARRGVSWIYIIAGRETSGTAGAAVTKDSACVVEAVYSTRGRANHFIDANGDLIFTEFPPRKLVKGGLCCRPLLPGEAFLQSHPTASQENGAMVRWQNYVYRTGYIDFNAGLFNKLHRTLYSDAFDETGLINRSYTEKNCPKMYYFAPQRETRDDFVLTTNHFIIPEMRYTAMNKWLAFLHGKLVQDSQWRYDAMNKLILDAIGSGPNGISKAKAKEILDFLSPNSAHYPGYYGSNKQVIDGSQSLFDLKELTVDSHYGYYSDDWVSLNLKGFFPQYP